MRHRGGAHLQPLNERSERKTSGFLGPGGTPVAVIRKVLSVAVEPKKQAKEGSTDSYFCVYISHIGAPIG